MLFHAKTICRDFDHLRIRRRPLVLVSASVGSLAGDLSAALVLCDRIAADPTDPDKPADVKGVTEIAPSDVATAIKFCKIASPSSRRALFQLGRAYAANGQLDR